MRNVWVTNTPPVIKFYAEQQPHNAPFSQHTAMTVGDHAHFGGSCDTYNAQVDRSQHTTYGMEKFGSMCSCVQY